jgi:hypothetical protein
MATYVLMLKGFFWRSSPPLLGTPSRPAYGPVVGGRSRYAVRALVFVILTPSKSSPVTARVPNAISIGGLKINKPVVAEIGRYRAFIAG